MSIIKKTCHLLRGAEPGRLFVCCKNAIFVAHPHPDGDRILGQFRLWQPKKKMV